MNRFAQLGVGLALGALWGVVMCLILLAAGRIDGIADWLYRISASALIGLAVATVFGTVTAARRGESLGSGRLWRRSR